MLMTEKTKVELGHLGTIEGKDMYNIARLDPQPIIDLYKEIEPSKANEIDLHREFFKVKNESTAYYFFARTNGVDVFIELPLVADDETFQWTRRDWGRCKTLWTQIKSGYLTFSCAYYLETKSVQINVRWNGSCIGNVWLDNATNEDIMQEINKWKARFLNDVEHSVA